MRGRRRRGARGDLTAAVSPFAFSEVESAGAKRVQCLEEGAAKSASARSRSVSTWRRFVLLASRRRVVATPALAVVAP
jgi:hypothetical protein